MKKWRAISFILYYFCIKNDMKTIQAKKCKFYINSYGYEKQHRFYMLLIFYSTPIKFHFVFILFSYKFDGVQVPDASLHNLDP